MAKKKAGPKGSRGSDGGRDGKVRAAPTDAIRAVASPKREDEAASPKGTPASIGESTDAAEAMPHDDAPIHIAPTRHAPAAAWGQPFVRIARGFEWLETRLLVLVLGALTLLLATWVSLVGMASPLQSESPAGTVFRGILGAVVLGGLSRLLGKKLDLPEARRNQLTVVAVVVAIVVAPMWRKTGVEYFGHLQNWLQEGSSFAMLGGLRGVGTRFTILLALVGGSLAAASGKHISIDVVLRFLPNRLKIPVFALSSISTAAVLLASAWGFVDYIAIESFNFKPADMQMAASAPKVSAGEELSFVVKHVRSDLFLFRKQVALDFSALPHVLGGGKWDDPTRMNGRRWNEIVEDGFRDHFPSEDVDAIRSPDDQLDESRIPVIVVPGGGGARGLLIATMNLMFPIGFLFIALRFLLRLALVASGHASVQEESAHAPTPAAPPTGEAV